MKLWRDNISGTAIRKGEKGMTTPKITEMLNLLDHLREGQNEQLFGKTVQLVNNRLEVADD
ncbi:hypothetical protein Q5R05_01865 [Leuconostoc carnosum]|uniref:hypothetical protein n=1 Tax=Leuconostoc carnosum TaxID=1252 RepID=UPI00272DE305|nr:hypothetical protein [Leuconostoc carnosum]WLC98132.1 hypothetical protein Q5R05_01865 [Leuconostoc carnosum]